MDFSEYTIKEVEEVFLKLKTSQEGLNEEEAKNRTKEFGYNEIKTKEKTLFDIFLHQIKSPFFYLLAFASLLALFLGEKIDSLLILIFIIINTAIGFFQEARAQKTISILKKYLPSKTCVIREGKKKIIEKKFLVPGDIVFLKAGDIVPADLRIFKTNNLMIDESVLTGESFPVFKTTSAIPQTSEIFEAKNIAFCGTSVLKGELYGIVIGTGGNTVLGKTIKLSPTIYQESTYEKDLINFSKIVLKIIILSTICVFLINTIIKRTEGLFDFLIFFIALTVSTVPEALPLVVTVSLSRGALKLAKRKVVLKRLSAIEDLGNIEILCTDKTGTITENKLVVDKIFSTDKEKCLFYAVLSSFLEKGDSRDFLDPFDSSIFKIAPKNLIIKTKNYKTISILPFDPFRARESILVEDSFFNRFLIVKGAPEKILELSSSFEGGLKKEDIEKDIKKEGEEGKRVLAIGYKKFDKETITEEDEGNLIFLGFLSFFDPLKETAIPSIRLAKRLGIKIKILTGDSKEVAVYVAKKIGLIKDEKEAILGKDLKLLSPEEFLNACKKFSVFARVSPEMKYEIIKALSKEHCVGFLGEGINDIPALKVSNVSLVVDSACDSAKEVSDIVLLERNLKVIIEGVKEGRNIFSNINKYIKTTLSTNFGNSYSLAFISLILPFLPMLPVQILLVNLLSDFPLVLVSTDSVDIEELKKPRFYQLKYFIFLILLLALTSSLFDFISFGIFYKTKPEVFRTCWFILSILTEIFIIFSVRTFHPFFKAKRPSLPIIVASFLTLIITFVLPFTHFGKDLFHFVPIKIHYLFIILFLVISYFMASEMVKLLYFKHWYKIER